MGYIYHQLLQNLNDLELLNHMNKLALFSVSGFFGTDVGIYY